MQDQQIIDHLIFRRLFAEAFSPSSIEGHRGYLGDEYVVEPSGVRWHQSDEEYLASPGGRLGGPSDHETLVVLQYMKDARLPFPCSPRQALEWVHRSADVWTYVPNWIKEALAQDSFASVHDILAKAAATLGAEIAAAVAEGDVQKERSALGERASLALAADAFRELERLVGSEEQKPEYLVQAAPSASLSASPVRIGNRSGGIGIDILAAAQNVGAPWSRPAVWNELVRMTMGKRVGCLVDVIVDSEGVATSIRYVDGDGNERDLTPKQLAERLVELRKKLR